MQPTSEADASKQSRRLASRGLGGRIRLSQHSGTPVYIQLADQLKYLIGIGELPPGSRLPSARLLSSNLNINRNTVLSAYAILAAESFVVGHRGAARSSPHRLPKRPTSAPSSSTRTCWR